MVAERQTGGSTFVRNTSCPSLGIAFPQSGEKRSPYVVDAGASRGGIGKHLSSYFMKACVSKLLKKATLVAFLGLIGGIGKTVGAALTSYTIPIVIEWVLK
jgi:hypothetical protein